ncbi:hypothetical protein BaRGS_00022007 [Batillaria attramentaria]|uniref:Uncharacterized protein n=1 Tax=Batillaria attramentaria TaxID=370345 RepID=A0ABD0KI31_9CAEN
MSNCFLVTGTRRPQQKHCRGDPRDPTLPQFTGSKTSSRELLNRFMFCKHHLLDASTLPPDDVQISAQASQSFASNIRDITIIRAHLLQATWCQQLLIKLQPSGDDTLLHYILRHCST